MLPELNLPSCELVLDALVVAAGAAWPQVADAFRESYLDAAVRPRREAAFECRDMLRAGVGGLPLFERWCARAGAALSLRDLASLDLLDAAVLRDPEGASFPPDKAALAEFLRLLVREAEQEDREVHEAVLEMSLSCQRSAAEAMRALMGGLDQTPSLCYRIYQVPAGQEQHLLRLRANPQIFNNVGMTTWPSGFLLAEVLLARSAEVRGRRVLELGAGTGVTSCVALRAGPASLWATDTGDEVLRLLRTNLELALRDAPADGDGATELRVGELDWTAPDATELGSFAADLVLAADCVYDREVIPDLVATVRAALGRRRGAQALVCSRVRNPETFAMFEAAVRGTPAMVWQELEVGEADVPRVFAPFVYSRDGLRLVRLTVADHDQHE